MTHPEFEHIAAQLRQRVLKVCLRFFDCREDAEDAAQESMERLWRYCEHIDAGRNVELLAVRVAKNCCVSLHRKWQHERHTTDVALLSQRIATPHSDSPQEQLEAEDLQKTALDVVALLKPRERQLFELRANLDLSNEEIAKQTGIPKASVAAMLSAARKKVFTELKRRMNQ